MYGPVLSVLMMGMVPVWGLQSQANVQMERLVISPPASTLTASLSLGSLRSLSASGVLIVDLDSGQTLYESRASVPRPMASLTKLMTALIIIENHDMEEWVTIPKEVENIESTHGLLKPGERFTVGDLLTASLVNSANDAAYALAVFHSGSMEKFAEEMNARAKELGLKGTSYANSIGLDEPKQYSTPRDLVWLTMYDLRQPEIAKRLAIRSATIYSQSGTVVGLTSTHTMMRKGSDIVAGKTGTTDDAGQCLMSVVEVDGRRFGVVLLNSADRYADMARVTALLDS